MRQAVGSYASTFILTVGLMLVENVRDKPRRRPIKNTRNRFCKQSNILCWRHAHSMAHPNLAAHHLCCAHLSVALAAHQVLARFLGLATYLGARSQKVLQTWGGPPRDSSNKFFAETDFASNRAYFARTMRIPWHTQIWPPISTVVLTCRSP